VVVLLVLVAPLRLRRVFHNRVLATLGVLSYSIYMIHAPFMQLALDALRSPAHPLVGWTPETTAVWGALSLACVGLSALTYRFIELPFLREKSRLDD
jgi:peptidoglycan/LPS O-acetylase OafA/YrhL